jgi:uncharacterized protein (DUF2235 family)
MSTQKRLIVCLDGTWNTEDSSTNVLHHFNLVLEGVDPVTGLYQKKHYHRGVGTNSFDRVTGGGLGFGLEQNVRDAYNWLVENYSDAGPDKPDEVYIFGFSRGAYTARSLVGFIGQCGLLRRGAPIPVADLWDAYCLLGRNREKRTSAWDNLFRQPTAKIRQITALATDPWYLAEHRAYSWIAPNPNPEEQLLIHWSRRIQIAYLGIYDTVGAIGWDALAIPGLTSRIAMHNNERPTTIIQRCRHALAIDEHRSSFQHTPFISYIGLGDVKSEADLKAKRKAWGDKIEQCWFVGAHSNVGGGYEYNRLAELPLQWILDGSGLALCDNPIWDPPPTPAQQPPKDSYAEFASPLWTKILRAKRYYRTIDPDPIRNASRRAAAADNDPPAGYSLESIHEEVDPSVFRYWAGSGKPLPPNLYDYGLRNGRITPAMLAPRHAWPGNRVWDFLALILWAALAGAGLASLCHVFGLDVARTWSGWVAGIAAFAFPFVDWSESLVNFERARGIRSPAFRAFQDSIYWTRAFGFVLFVCGLAVTLQAVGLLVWGWFGWQWNAAAMTNLAGDYWRLPLLAAVATAAATAVNAARNLSKPARVSLLLVPVEILGAVAAAFALFRMGGNLCQASRPGGPAECVNFTAGLLLALQCALVYFWRAWLWTAKPMAKAHLGSILSLQVCITPSQVGRCLDRWYRMLQLRWEERDPTAVDRLRDVVGEALWRDMVGFIPVYTAFLVFGLWFGALRLHWSPPGFLQTPGIGNAWWWLIPAICAAANYLEDACHLTFLRLPVPGSKPGWPLTVLSGAMFAVKAVTFAAALAITAWAVMAGTFQVSVQCLDWRAKSAILISGGFLLAIAVYLTGLVIRQVQIWWPSGEREK